jgi:hypothetical protein
MARNVKKIVKFYGVILTYTLPFQKAVFVLSVVAQACNPSTGEAEAMSLRPV